MKEMLAANTLFDIWYSIFCELSILANKRNVSCQCIIGQVDVCQSPIYGVIWESKFIWYANSDMKIPNHDLKSWNSNLKLWNSDLELWNSNLKMPNNQIKFVTSNYYSSSSDFTFATSNISFVALNGVFISSLRIIGLWFQMASSFHHFESLFRSFGWSL